MDTGLKKQTIKGVFWSSVERFGTQFIVLITQIILARLLSPHDFGLIGILIIFITISNVFVDSGFGNALIQKKNANEIDFSTVFYCNIIISTVLYIILFCTSPFIAVFFNQKELAWLIRLVGLVLIFNSFGVVQFAIFRKKLIFKAIARATVIANILSALIGITLAYLNYGIMALAIQMILTHFLKTLLFWMQSSWRPKLMFSKQSFSELFQFGYKLLLSGLLDQIFQNVYLFIIGKLYTTKDLGHYTQARNFQQVPVSTLFAIVGSVTFPAFSKIQDDAEKLLIGVRKTIKILGFINFPLMLGLSVTAEPLFKYILGEKWLPAVPYFKLLCISGMLYTLHAVNLLILQVKGRSDLFLKVEVYKKIIMIVAILIGINWGIIGLVWSHVASSFISYFVNAVYSKKLIGYSIMQQLKDLFPTIITTIFMSTLMYSITEAASISLGIFILQILLGGFSYFVISFITRNDALVDSLNILRDLIPIEKWKRKKF